MAGQGLALPLTKYCVKIITMTEHVKKIIGQVERLSQSEQSELVDAILSLKKKAGKKSILDFVGIWNGGKALYSRLDRDSIYEK